MSISRRAALYLRRSHHACPWTDAFGSQSQQHGGMRDNLPRWANGRCVQSRSASSSAPDAYAVPFNVRLDTHTASLLLSPMMSTRCAAQPGDSSAEVSLLHIPSNALRHVVLDICCR